MRPKSFDSGRNYLEVTFLLLAGLKAVVLADNLSVRPAYSLKCFVFTLIKGLDPFTLALLIRLKKETNNRR